MEQTQYPVNHPVILDLDQIVKERFGDVIETGILIKFDELHAEKTRRHLNLPNFQEIRYRLLHLRKKNRNFVF